MAEDLTQDIAMKLAPYLDNHLVIPLLEFLERKATYPMDAIFTVKVDLLKKTKMVDYVVDAQKELLNYDPLSSTDQENMDQKRRDVLQELNSIRDQVSILLTLMESDGLPCELDKLLEERNLTPSYLQDNYEITPADIDALFDYAKLRYECGDYVSSGNCLHYFRLLCTDSEKLFASLWGKLASEILMEEWEEAHLDVIALKNAIEERTESAPMQLQQRSWLMHWGLFVFFNRPEGHKEILDFFFQERYINAIQSNCPHILRYLAAAALINNYKIKELVNILEQEKSYYSDPITELVRCLYVDIDFESAQTRLQECEEVLGVDFFLHNFADGFIENARQNIFETFCRIHHRIDLSMLSRRLNMDEDSAEKWIVNLIRRAQLDAKIDSKDRQIFMHPSHPSVYQQVFQRTSDLCFRTMVLFNNIEKRKDISQPRRNQPRKK